MKTFLVFLLLTGMVEMAVAQSQTTNKTATPATNAIAATPETAVVQMWVTRLNAAAELPTVSSSSPNNQKDGKSIFAGAGDVSVQAGGGGRATSAGGVASAGGDAGAGSGSARRGGGDEFDSQLKEIERLAAKWAASRNEADFAKLAEAVRVMAKERGITSEVTIETPLGEGALVKYQTEEGRKRGETPTTCKHLTRAVEEIQLGVFYIWSERKGKATSSPNSKFNIAALEEQVVLEEIR